jgi:hypothetical protein
MLSHTFLVFKNVSPQHGSLLEFLRMLIQTKSIPIVSEIDSKVFRQYKLHPFTVIAHTDSISNFSPRFLSLFAPIQIYPFSDSSNSYLSESLLRHFNVPQDSIDLCLRLGKNILNSSSLFKSFLPLCYLQNKNLWQDFIRTLISNFYQEGIANYNKSEIIALVQNSLIPSEYQNFVFEALNLSSY